jgi:murein DD-endopeptidase MepM/ murein hydrolase activator NlpD
VLLIAVLALVNLYVFVWRDKGLLSGRGPATVLPLEDGVASAPAAACSGDPVRIFEGLDALLRVKTRLADGRTLRLGLLELGVASPEIDAIEAEVRAHIDLGLLAGSGAGLVIAQDRHGSVHGLEIELAEGHLVQACRGPTGLRARNIQHPLRTDVEVVALTLPEDGDLVRAIEDRGEKPELAGVLAEALAHDVDLLVETRPGDELSAIVEKRHLGRHFHRYGTVLAVRYHGAAGHVGRYLYKPTGRRAAFFDADGQPTRRVLLRSPIGWYRSDPSARATLAPTIEFVGGEVGAVYRQPEGAPVLALADGVVRTVSHREASGLTLELSLPDGRVLRYCRLLRLIGQLEPGTPVEQGQLVGLVGHSGQTPVDALRLEVVEPGTGARLDPVAVTTGDAKGERVGEPIPVAFREEFSRDIAPWRRALKQAG